ncbi:MAG: hypothetical protein B6D36_00055 [Planctomycetes bacterium UTPLA1]|nr:MAG: hypothetical protein B6D36_00055 [Planctomycetes bacterium UTPLA1]
MDRYVDGLTRGELDEALGRIAVHFIPKREAVERQVQDLAEKAPLQAMIPKVIFDHQRPVATIGSVQDDLEGNVLSQIASNIQIESVFLRAGLARLEQEEKLTSDSLGEMLRESPAFTEQGRALVEGGISAYISGDHLASCSILVPQLEAALRTLLALTGGSIYRQGRNGLAVLRPLDDILRDSVLVGALGSDVADYFRVVLTDPRGLNLRNAICHGFAPPDIFNQTIADRILHLLIVLGQLRKADPTDTAGS